MAKYIKGTFLITNETSFISEIEIINIFSTENKEEWYIVNFTGHSSTNIKVLAFIIEESYHINFRKIFNKL